MKCNVCGQQIIDERMFHVRLCELDDSDAVRESEAEPVLNVLEEGNVCLGCSSISVENAVD